ncbi:MAG TPA: response regulator [Steroidobacteraceae bacterium]|nr:response regulator [Steroidobacteraceae bacterium]
MARQPVLPTALRGRWILIVEDDCVTAMDLAETLSAAGAQIIGPATTIETAFELLHRRPPLDIALLDVEIEGTYVFDVADEIVRRKVPIVFTTGYERSEIPQRFCATRHCEKPVSIGAIAQALSDELALHQLSSCT